MIEFRNTIILVKDIRLSKDFYERVLGLRVLNDSSTIVFFENHLVIHDANAFLRTVFKRRSSSMAPLGKKNIDIYFEASDIDASFETIRWQGVTMIHDIETQAWGQRVFRFYDPDGHILGVGEPMVSGS